jgi:hypothetical protein
VPTRRYIADLEWAQRRVEDGLRRVAEQRDRIAWMTTRGLNTAEAEQVYDLMLKLFDQMIHHRDEIAEALREAGNGSERDR